MMDPTLTIEMTKVGDATDVRCFRNFVCFMYFLNSGSYIIRFKYLFLWDTLNLNPVDSYLGNTALHLASGLGLTSVVEALLNKNASVQATDANGYTPLHVRIQSSNIQCSVKNKFHHNCICWDYNPATKEADEGKNYNSAKVLYWILIPI